MLIKQTGAAASARVDRHDLKDNGGGIGKEEKGRPGVSRSDGWRKEKKGRQRIRT